MTKESKNDRFEPSTQPIRASDPRNDSVESLLRLLSELSIIDQPKKNQSKTDQNAIAKNLKSAKPSLVESQNDQNSNGDGSNRAQVESSHSDHKSQNSQLSDSKNNGSSNGRGKSLDWQGSPNSVRNRIKEILASPIQTESLSALSQLQFDDLTYETAPEDNPFDGEISLEEDEIQVSDSEYLEPIERTPSLDIQPEQELAAEQLSNLLDSLNHWDNSNLPKPKDETAQLQVLQNILVEPELVEVRGLLEMVELKLSTLQTQVNDPAMEQKLKELESQMSDNSEMGDMQQQLVELASQQTNLLTNIPTEITNLRQRLIDIEHHLYEPEQLVNLLMPVIAELLNRKVIESKDDISHAIVPIIDSVIHQRVQEDKIAMSNALAEIIPAAISRQIQNSPKEIALAIGPEIGAAIKEQIRLDRDVIANALAPEMGAAIKQQILLERDAMVDALYPVIGATISKYLSEAIRAINERVESTFSPEGISRKFRAKMQGVSEAELIFKESMPFQAQAVFLIQKDSGLVIVDLQRSSDDPDVSALESDMIAGMLTAIRTFVNDCIARSGNISELDAIDYGGSKIVLEVAGYCYLAVVIQGEPDKKFILKIRDTLAGLIQNYGKPIEQFEGDPDTIPSAVFERLRPLLDKIDPEKSKKSSRTLSVLGLVALGLILVPWGFFQYRSMIDRRLEAKTVNAIASTPELAVYRLNVTADGDKLKLSGQLPNQYLRNRVVQVTQQANQADYPKLAIDNQIVAVDVPPDPSLAAAEVQRLTAILNQTPGTEIALSFKGDKITITGKVREPAIAAQITQALSKIPGVKYITNTVTVLPLELTTRVYFYTGSSDLRPEDTARILEAKAFLERYPSYHLKILGRSDPVGDPFSNQQLATNRAQAVYEALVQRGVDRKRLSIIGLDYHLNGTDPKEPLWMSRRVEFMPVIAPN
jgi:outer membrane protein OmpA-like peptidoglycan-associated protein